MHARQFYDDAVRTLLLHRRLRHAECVNTIEQRSPVCLQRIALYLQHRIGSHAHVEHEEVPFFAVLQLQLGEVAY